MTKSDAINLALHAILLGGACGGLTYHASQGHMPYALAAAALGGLIGMAFATISNLRSHARPLMQVWHGALFSLLGGAIGAFIAYLRNTDLPYAAIIGLGVGLTLASVAFFSRQGHRFRSPPNQE